jgi:hypothetical protein
VQVRGDLTPDRLRAALDKAQRRHPLLRVNTEIGPDGRPWFSSDGVGAIPLAVVDGAAPEDARALVEREVDATFARDDGGAPRLPLLRVSLLRPREATDPIGVVLTAQHIVADGLSLVFLFRDLLGFLDDPDAPVAVLDAPASPADLLPAGVRRRIPRSPVRFRATLWLLRAYARLRFGRKPAPARRHTQHHRSWTLTPEQTSRLRARCRNEGVSIQSAIGTAFLPGFDEIHTPVSLRPLLGRPGGESVGLFVGSADVKMRFRASRGFWNNARRFHRRLRRAMRDPFRMFRLFSKVVPVAAVQQLGLLMVRMMSGQRLLSITNLGQLDTGGLQLRARTLKIESFFGATTGLFDASVLTVYTIDGCMHLHLLANETEGAAISVSDESERAVQALVDAA